MGGPRTVVLGARLLAVGGACRSLVLMLLVSAGKQLRRGALRLEGQSGTSGQLREVYAGWRPREGREGQSRAPTPAPAASNAAAFVEYLCPVARAMLSSDLPAQRQAQWPAQRQANLGRSWRILDERRRV